MPSASLGRVTKMKHLIFYSFMSLANLIVWVKTSSNLNLSLDLTSLILAIIIYMCVENE